MLLQQVLLTLSHLILPVLVLLKFKFTIVTAVLLPYAIVSYPLLIEDFRNKRLPNRMIYPATIATLIIITAYAIYRHDFGIFSQPVGRAIISFLISLVLYLIARGGFGAGDVKLFFLSGLTLGIFTPAHLIAATIFACLGVALFAIVLLITKRASSKTTVPFGPFIIIGSWLAVLLFN
ncbi:unannotated protein [freshwater metagenome]|uniref:Unannotated protein n=1 Tax=freshwater metagenome TaxID=449393 RepID=A0A6J7MA87_9ZZZZ